MFILYPIIVALVGFFFFKFDNHDAGAFFFWMLTLVLTAFCGAFWGFGFGCFFKSEVGATQANMLFLMMFCFGAGFYANTGDGANIVVQLISYISPLRYSSELLMRSAMEDKPGGDAVLEVFGFTWGTSLCIGILVVFTVVTFFGGWITLLWKNRKI